MERTYLWRGAAYREELSLEEGHTGKRITEGEGLHLKEVYARSTRGGEPCKGKSYTWRGVIHGGSYSRRYVTHGRKS